ncbi:hypothetical protein BC938DRAFT_474651 [Jimgerdemannia flammicorona]|uniref:Uncharacterized protein n=1 Tax=Jimgerdemannia flammicorona TaxID=994334 RepID=A0A433Q1Z0_9FUNG|nr:hypothetical protein BC938DRAFT_474651 [Jimgerdemannia flammicorona]
MSSLFDVKGFPTIKVFPPELRKLKRALACSSRGPLTRVTLGKYPPLPNTQTTRARAKPRPLLTTSFQ